MNIIAAKEAYFFFDNESMALWRSGLNEIDNLDSSNAYYRIRIIFKEGVMLLVL